MPSITLPLTSGGEEIMERIVFTGKIGQNYAMKNLKEAMDSVILTDSIWLSWPSLGGDP